MTTWDLPEDSPSGSTAYLGVSPKEWPERLARRAARWAAEDAALAAQREQEILADRDLRRTEWPVDRIRAVMAQAREEGK